MKTELKSESTIKSEWVETDYGFTIDLKTWINNQNFPEGFANLGLMFVLVRNDGIGTHLRAFAKINDKHTCFTVEL